MFDCPLSPGVSPINIHSNKKMVTPGLFRQDIEELASPKNFRKQQT